MNWALPAATEPGLMLMITGSGGEMLKITGFDVPAGVDTVTLAEPTVATRLAGTVAWAMPD